MSTLPGQASKGEKTKSKFQSLDINSLYRVSRGENLEKQQQKSSSVYIRHGMQSLGKVPNARRAPVNLPSLKAEHSGSDAAVPLVPPGAQGWGKQDSNTSQPPSTPTTHTPPQNSTASPSSNANQQATPQISSHQAAIALPVTTTIPPHPHKQLTPTAQPVPTDKLWSSVTSGQEVPHPPLYQSPQFQHEFPSLSAGDGAPTRTGSDAPQYPSGLSLRPQTEGSWTQGGQRPVGAQGAAGPETSPGRPGSAHQGAPPQLAAQVGQQQQPFPPQIRGVMPSFMCKGSNFHQQGPGTPNQNPPTLPPSMNGRGGRPVDNRPPRLAERDGEEVAPRPIIKEEELSQMDEIGKDMGWAESDEIDYNQKLAFSDDEGEKSTKRDVRRSQQHRDQREDHGESHNVDGQRQWSGSRSSTSRGRSSEEEDIWMQRRSQTDKEVEIAVQRAKQRKEEEEKRFSEERKQAAAKKLSELNERINKRDRDNHEGIGTINPATIPPKPINHVDIPLPDFQKDKEREKDPQRERDSRSRTPNETVEDKNQSATQGNSFRQLTQIEGKNFLGRKHSKASDRDSRDSREQNGPSFSKHFKEDLPPRFLKHQRNNSNSNLQSHQQQSYQHQQNHQQPHQQQSHQQQSHQQQSHQQQSHQQQSHQQQSHQQQSHQQQSHQQQSHQQQSHQQQSHQQQSHQQHQQSHQQSHQQQQLQQPQQQQTQQYPQPNFDNRWTMNKQNNLNNQPTAGHNLLHNRNTRQGSPEVEREEERKDYRRQSSEDSFRSSYHSQDNTPKPVVETAYQDEFRENRHQAHYEQQHFGRREQHENSWHKEVEKADSKKQEHAARPSHEDRGEKRDKIREDKPDRYERDNRQQQRPDSRDNRSAARHSRDSEPRDYMGSWSDAAYDHPYDEKRRDHVREDRRVVPGPITKERIEADDMRNEKRNLTQLKRGQPVEVRSEIKKPEKEEEQKKEPQFVSAWADALPPALEELQNKAAEEKKLADSHKSVTKQAAEAPKKQEKIDDHNQNRNRTYGQKKGWGNAPNEYHHAPRGQPWQRRPPSRGQKSYHGTDSDGSAEDHSAHQKQQDGQKSETNDQKSPNPARKVEKDEKNRENRQEKYASDQRKQDKPDKRDGNYVPRGEPSRHGRGGGNFRSGRMGMGKRIDGYGPPPAKSPFGGHQEEKEEKKVSGDEATSSENLSVVEDKTKQNQQALAAGIIGKRPESVQSTDDKNKPRNKPDVQKTKPKVGEKVCDTNSENSDDKNRDGRKMQGKPQGSNRPASNTNRGGRNAGPPPRLGGDRRYESNRSEVRHESGRTDNARPDTNRNENRLGDVRNADNRHEAPRSDTIRQNSSGSLKKEDKPNDQNASNATSDVAAKNRDGEQVEEKEEKTSVNGDSEGFQEVKSKKAVKERQKSVDDKTSKVVPKNDTVKEAIKTDRERKGKINPATQMLTQQQIQNIPSLMATPVQPPPNLPQTKSQFDRSRQTKLPPRFAKQKLQKQAMQHQQQQQQQQHHGMCDMNDINKVNQNINVYGLKDANAPPPPVPTCAWDKPLGPQLRNMEHDNMLAVSMEGVKALEPTHSPSQGISPNNEKMMNKGGQLQDKTLLDGATPPVNTIIFENTNFKSAPGPRGGRNDKPRSKLDEGNMDPAVMPGFNKPTMNELLQGKSDKPDSLPMPLFKEDTSDMKLDFFSADLQFTDDKTKNFVSKSIHAITSCNNTVDSLDYKIASVKKVWETSEQEGEDTNQINFGAQLDSNVFSQGKDPSDDTHEGYSPSPNQTASTTTNVCKVKPTQQVSGSGQTMLSSSGHQQHAGIVAQGLMGNPLSPPPIPPVLGAGVGIGPQYSTNQHLGYQTGLTGNTQFGISAIPSPPTVPLVYNSSQQQIQAAAQTAGLYGAFQLEQLSGQGRSQFSPYANYHGLGQTANSPYSTQSVYLPTAPPHPPPAAQAPPELYQNMNSYRISAAASFAQNQQLNNPTTVLISSTSNSLMSASVKPSSQQISAIGTKAGGVGQAYQPQSQQSQQVFMTYDPSLQANYLASNAGVMQRAPVAPSQNNVVPGLQPSSSYYSGSTGGQSGYYQQPGSSTMPSAQLAQHQASFGLQGSVFGTHNQSHTNTGMQNYNSHFLTTPMQVAAAAAAMNVQQFRSSLPAAYMKSLGNQQVGDPTGRPQQLKSPSSQEVLSSVFNSGPQIPSPKSRQNSKHPPPQSSPTAQHKYNLYQGVGGQQNTNLPRYPSPIQRPVFQQLQQNMSVNQKHRSNPNNKPPNRYYGGQNHSMPGHHEKSDDRKMNDGNGLSSGGGSVCSTKSSLGSGTGSAASAMSEKVKDNIKEEAAALKD